MWTLIKKFQDELIVFSRRDDPEQLEHYAAFPHHIMTWKTRARGSRYQALNLENHNTVEFRFPKGTLFHDEYVATVAFCVGLARWALNNELEDVASISWYELVSEILDTIEIGALRETLLIYLCRYGLYWENDTLRVRLGDVFQDIATVEIPRLEQASAAD